jgi:hypothetical protein
VVCPELLQRPVETAGSLLAFVVLRTITILSHYHRPISFGFLDGWLVTPASHAIHHSRDPAHHDRNFGITLGIWDRLFSTYHHPRAEELGRLSYGLEETQHLSGRILPLHYFYVTLTRDAWRAFVRSCRTLLARGSADPLVLAQLALTGEAVLATRARGSTHHAQS